MRTPMCDQICDSFRYEVVRNRMSDFVNVLVSKEISQDLDATEIIIVFVHCLEVSNKLIN